MYHKKSLFITEGAFFMAYRTEGLATKLLNQLFHWVVSLPVLFDFYSDFTWFGICITIVVTCLVFSSSYSRDVIFIKTLRCNVSTNLIHIMSMIYLSKLTIFLFTLFSGIIGGIIGWYWKKQSEGTWKEDFKVLEKENKSLEKKTKKANKDNIRLKKQVDNWKEKVENLDIEYKSQVANLKEQIALAKTTDKKQVEQIRQLESTNKNTKNSLDRLENAHIKLKEKYNLDMADLKEWRKNKDKFNREVKDIKSQLKVANEKVIRLTNANEKMAKEIEENNAFVSKLRSLKAVNKKLKEDIKYWEKKHYDTHHELAALKDTFEELTNKHQSLELQSQSVSQNNQQMLQKVQEFKTRFVDVHNKYHKLLESQKN